VTALLFGVAVVVVVATALALAGMWQPQGLPDAAPDGTGEDSPNGDGEVRFDVVLRGYRMDQVDAELARLHELLRQAGYEEAQQVEVPQEPAGSTIQE
jgi:DivIVA domain-containing protein